MVGWKWVALVFFAAALAVGVGALVSQSDTKTLSEAETKSLLRELPYRFEFRPVSTPDGASGAVGGRAFGPHHTVVGFGISLGGGGAPVSVDPHPGLTDATGGETFLVTNDSMIMVGGKLREAPWLRTRAQWNESSTMIVDIEEKLCRATEGKPCGI